MIAHHVPMKSVEKSNFGELVKYLTDDQNKNERVVYTIITNCESNRLDASIIEVAAIQGINTRASSDKTYHLIISFRAGEIPHESLLKALESEICEGLGFGEHQRISVVHNDTDNLHIHIAINKIHPKTYKIHAPFNDYKILAKLCESLEVKYSLEKDNHIAMKTGSETRANDMEHHAGVESLLGWIKRGCLIELLAASSWTDLHRILHENSLELKERGNGLVIINQDGLMVKASSVDRELSKSKLVGKLGKFTPSLTTKLTAIKKYSASPVNFRTDTTLLFARYKAEQQKLTVNRSQSLKFIRDKRNRRINMLKRKAKLNRATIQLSGGSRIEKKILYALASNSFQRDMQGIIDQYNQDKAKIIEKNGTQAWADWLRTQATNGDKDALVALRSRTVAQGLKGNVISINSKQIKSANLHTYADEAAPALDSITKKGTIIMKNSTRFDGNKLKVKENATVEELKAVLIEAMKRNGNNIDVEGTETFKKQMVQAAIESDLPVTFSDTEMELRRLQLLQTVKKQQPLKI